MTIRTWWGRLILYRIDRLISCLINLICCVSPVLVFASPSFLWCTVRNSCYVLFYGYNIISSSTPPPPCLDWSNSIKRLDVINFQYIPHVLGCLIIPWHFHNPTFWYFLVSLSAFSFIFFWISLPFLLGILKRTIRMTKAISLYARQSSVM